MRDAVLGLVVEVLRARVADDRHVLLLVVLDEGLVAVVQVLHVLEDVDLRDAREHLVARGAAEQRQLEVAERMG